MSDPDNDLDEPNEEDSEPCPCCGDELHVGHRIYCYRGCELKWHDHGALSDEESDYPESCPHDPPDARGDS